MTSDADDANWFPRTPVEFGHVQPVPRRIRALLGGVAVVDTLRARYVWEQRSYPQYHLPLADLRPGVLVEEGPVEQHPLGPALRCGLRVGDLHRPGSALVYQGGAAAGIADTVRLHWPALDAWYEEDEQVFVHPRSPYVRVDAVRSTRTVRVSAGGVLLAESSAPVMVFETGLPTRYYLDRTAVDFGRLVPSATRTGCPYKGRTTGCWSVPGLGDVAWSYDFAVGSLAAIAGLVAFYDEKLDIAVDGVPQPRPVTSFS